MHFRIVQDNLIIQNKQLIPITNSKKYICCAESMFFLIKKPQPLFVKYKKFYT